MAAFLKGLSLVRDCFCSLVGWTWCSSGPFSHGLVVQRPGLSSLLGPTRWRSVGLVAGRYSCRFVAGGLCFSWGLAGVALRMGARQAEGCLSPAVLATSPWSGSAA